MFGDIGWAELLLIGIVALIVIGPEDLPQMFRQLGRFTAKMRAMSRDFSRAMDQAAKESGVKDVSDSLKGATSATSMGMNKVKAAADRFEKWDPLKATTTPSAMPGPIVPPPMPATPERTSNPAAPIDATIHGPETQALLKKHAAKKAVLAETAEKLKAIASGDVTPASAPVKRSAPRKAIKAVDVVPDVVESAVAKPRAPRKSKKATDA